MLTRRYPILTTPKNSFEVFDEFDKIAGSMFKKSDNYPPYNIYSVEEDNPVIEMSVTGFDKSEIDVQFYTDEGELVIKGTKTVPEDETYVPEKAYSYRGLSMKNFTRTFTVNSNLEVDEITMENGLLTVTFNRKEKKTISYTIN